VIDDPHHCLCHRVGRDSRLPSLSGAASHARVLGLFKSNKFAIFASSGRGSWKLPRALEDHPRGR
jgi:hypothetical protein